MIVIDPSSPLAAGVSLADTSGNRWGAMGVFAMHPLSKRLFGLTTGLLARKGNDEVARLTEDGSYEVVGRIGVMPRDDSLTRRSITERLALIEFSVSPDLPPPGAGGDPADPLTLLGGVVRRVGGNSEPVKGTVVTVRGVVRLPAADGSGRHEFVDVLEVEGADGCCFATDGDGGSLVVSGEGVPVGIVVGVGKGTTFVAPLSVVLPHFGMKLLPLSWQLLPAMSKVPMPSLVNDEVADGARKAYVARHYAGFLAEAFGGYPAGQYQVAIDRLSETTKLWSSMRLNSGEQFEYDRKRFSNSEVVYAFGLYAGIAAAKLEVKDVQRRLVSSDAVSSKDHKKRKDHSSADIRKLLHSKPVTFGKGVWLLSSLDSMLGKSERHYLDDVILDAAIWVVADDATYIIVQTIRNPARLKDFNGYFKTMTNAPTVEVAVVKELLTEISEGFSITGWMSSVVTRAFGILGSRLSFQAPGPDQLPTTSYRPARSERLVLRELGGNGSVER